MKKFLYQLRELVYDWLTEYPPFEGCEECRTYVDYQGNGVWSCDCGLLKGEDND